VGAPHAEDRVHAGNRGRGQDGGVRARGARRRDHDHLAHAGNAGRDGVHQHRGRIGRVPARYVEADTMQRGHRLAELQARRVAIAPTARHLTPWKAAMRRAAKRSARNAPGDTARMASWISSALTRNCAGLSVTRS